MKSEHKQIPSDATTAAPALRHDENVANGEAMLAFFRARHSYNEGLVLLGQEVLDFARQRLSRDGATALSMARCGDWGEASKIQREWVRAMTEEYSAEMGKLFQLTVKTALDSCRPIQEHTNSIWSEPNGRG